jgi:predicted HTH domain antitoxin
VIEVTVKMPDEIARKLGATPEDMARQLLESTAIEGYRAGRLSHRQVAEMLGLDYWQAETFLSDRRVALNNGVADLDTDRAALDKLLGNQ